jgi:hypothetical protein
MEFPARQAIPIAPKGQKVPAPLIAVYRMHQPTFISPCILGEPCHTCAMHAPCQMGHPCKGCRRGKSYECERAYPAPPAFAVRIAAALQLVRDGAAVFIHQNNALQLTFAKLIHLRDISCKVDGRIIYQYVINSRWVQLAVNLGWGLPIADIIIFESEPETKTDVEVETQSSAGLPEKRQIVPCFS